MSLVVLGVDPHKQSHTATALAAGSQQQLGSVRIPASTTGYQQLLGWAPQFPQRRWAIENARGLGCHLTQWLLARGEAVQDVRTTATARVRELSRGRGRKTPAMSSCGGIGCLLGEPLGSSMLDWVVGHLVDPAAPDNPDPGASKDASGVG
jgi:hypothetical protein